MRKVCLLLLFILMAGKSFGADGASLDDIKRSLEAARHASILLRDGQFEEALVEYRRAEALSSDEKLRGTIDEIQARIIKNAENKAAAETLRRQAIVNIADGNLDLAIERLQESLSLYDDSDVRYELALLEGRYKAETQKQRTAQEIFRIAEQLEQRGELNAALAKLEEAQNIWALSQIPPLMQKIQAGIEKNQADAVEAAKLAEEGVQLEIRANSEQEGDLERLQQALEKFKKSYEIFPAPDVDMAIIQTRQNILKVSRDITEAEKKAKEARLLEGQGRLDAALEVYNISLNFRQDSEVTKELQALEKKISEEASQEKLANDLYAEAAQLEAEGKISEALVTVNSALEVFKKPEGEALKLRIEKAVTERDQRKAKGAELSDKAKQLREQNLYTEALDMYWESWTAWPYSTDTRDAINELDAIVKDRKTTEDRARRLYNEGLALEGEDRFEEAIERITGSLALFPFKDAENKLAGLKTAVAYNKWLDALLMQPLELKSEPALPMVGQLASVRIDGSGWLDSDKLGYKWELSDNARDVNNTDGGKSVNFRASDETPVIAKLEVFSKEAKNPETPIMEKKLSIIADSYTIGINTASMDALYQKWNPVKKQLEPVNELVTMSNILIRADVYPSVEEAVYEWSADDATLISGDNGKVEVNIRRNAPGVSKVNVAVKGPSGIELGRAETNIAVPVAHEDVLMDAERAKAWDIWLESQKLWTEGKRREAIKKAASASSIDPADPDISIGLTQLHNDNARIEEAHYLLAVSSLRQLEDNYEEALLSLKESERLLPDEKKRLLIFNLENEINESQNTTALAERFRAEGDWLLGQQRKVEAISKYRESLLLRDNEHLIAEVQRLTEEVEKDNQTRVKRKELLQSAFSLISKQRFEEASELLSQDLALQEDEAIRTYSLIVEQRAIEEKELKERAGVIRKEADELFKEKKLPEAFAAFRRSLETWQDGELEEWLAQEEKKYNETQAANLRGEAERHIRRKRRDEAVQAYRESLKFAYNKTADNYVKEADAEAARARADELVSEAEALVKQEKHEEAIETYKTALTKVPGDEKIIGEIKKLEQILLKDVAEPNDVTLSVDGKPEDDAVSGDVVSDDSASNDSSSEQLRAADKLFREANALYTAKNYDEALLKYKESYELSQNAKLKEFIDRLEKAMKDVNDANSFVRKANELYRQGKFQEALENYKESLKIYKNPKVEEFIKKVETLIE